MSHTNLFLFAWIPGGWEWLVILIVAVLLFGRKLPEIARSVGRSLTEFKRGMADVQDEIAAAGEETPTPPPAGETAEASPAAADGSDA